MFKPTLILLLAVTAVCVFGMASADAGSIKHAPHYKRHTARHTRHLMRGALLNTTLYKQAVRKTASANVVFDASALGVPQVDLDADTALILPAENLVKLAQASFDAGDFARATQLCQEALAVSPIINGAVQYDERAYRLLGRIALAQGDNQGALNNYAQAFPITTPFSMGTDAGFDIALAYCRLGNYDAARSWIATQHAEDFSEDAVCQQDQPGVGTPTSLEATILVLRSEWDSCTGGNGLADAAAAAALLPGCPVIEFQYGDRLTCQQRFADALPHLRLSASLGHGPLALCASRDANQAQGALDRQAAQMAQTTPSASVTPPATQTAASAQP